MTFKENSGIFARIFTKQWIKIYFSPSRMLSTWRGIARTLMSRMEKRASSLINSFNRLKLEKHHVNESQTRIVTGFRVSSALCLKSPTVGPLTFGI